MKKILYAIIAIAASVTLTCCKSADYLSVSNPSKMDDEFVTSSVSETFKTLAYCYRTYLSVAGGGNYNWNDSASDTEYYPEYASNNGRIGYLRPSEAGVDNKSSQFNNLFKIIGRCARVANILAEKEVVSSALASGTVNDWTQLYGEAWTLWGYCYFELVKHFGDVPFGIENSIVEEYGLTNRFDILDAVIAKLKAVEGSMYELGQGGITAERMSRTFANALIAECNLFAGGYQTIRTDVSGLYDGRTFETMYTNDASKSQFARVSTWQNYYKEAQTYLRSIVSGSHKATLTLITTDNRGLANPFQRNFQYIMDMEVSPESIFEVGNMAPQQSERPYSQGRPSDGGNSGAACCKVFSGIRVIPTFYYQGFEDGDLRWDASAVVTGSDGKGSEAIVTLGTGSRLNGGIAINKWDINKMKNPYVTKCRNSGMNFQFYRMPTTMLRLAEVDLMLGDSASEALQLVNQLRSRAGVAALSTVTIDDVIAECKRETLGEGDIKFMELRTGKFTTLGKAMRTELKEVIAGLEADGYYTFSNGRTISNYVWTKSVDLSGEGKAQNTYNRDETNPALTPGWRGGYDYTKTASSGAVVGTLHNLAIEGLFEYIDPDGLVAAALEAAGYKKVEWGKKMVDQKSALWDYNMLSGIDLSDVPLYYHPIPRETIQQSKGGVTNGYGLPNE